MHVKLQDCTWHDVTVDTRIPCRSAPDTQQQQQQQQQQLIPAFGRCVSAGNMWVPILEKAFAKLYGSYGALQGGELPETLQSSSRFTCSCLCAVHATRCTFEKACDA
jgi:hypothetical protein